MKTTFLKCITLITVLFFISGCPDFFEPPMVKYETGMGGFSLTINEQGRTIMPATVQGDFASYTLEFFPAGTAAEPGVTVNRTNANLSVPVLLNAGIWDLHVTAYLEDVNGELKPAAFGILERINIGEGETVDGFVSLKPIIDGGMGTFSWNIDYPSDVTAASMTVIPLNETDDMSEGETWYFIGGEPLVGKEDSLSLNAGYYRVDFELQLNDERRAVRREILHIYQNMESFFSFTFTDRYFPADPLGVILAAWDDDTSRWYLSGTDITAAYFLICGVEGIDDDNFEDIINWFDSAIDSPAADATELKILVDVALVGAAGNSTGFCNAGSYADRNAAEAAVGLLIKNGTPIITGWNGYTAVTVELAELYQVQITFNGEILHPITGIEIAALPNKTVYLMGEIFSSTGLRVNNVYADDTRRETSSYTVSRGNNQIINGNFRSGSFPVTVSANGYNSSFDITVSNTLVDTGLPVIYIETQNAAPIADRENWINMNLAITSDNPAHCLEKTGSTEFPDQIRGRGNSTWTYPKKPYRIRFHEETSLFGMVPARNWVLLANFRDPTLLSNTVAFEVGQRFGFPFTCHYVHVDVVLNGEYQGSYVLTEHIRVEEGRVDIDRNNGYLVELDLRYDEDPKFRTTSLNLPVEIHHPDLGPDASHSGYDFVKNSLNEFASTLSNSNFPNNNYTDILDIDNFVDFLLINDIVLNEELEGPFSTFLYKENVVKKIKMGPLWDFDYGFGLRSEGGYATINVSTAELRSTEWRILSGWLFGRFHNDPVFASKYKIRWNEKLPDILSISAFIDEMYNRLQTSASLDSRRWRGTNYEYEVGKLKEWWNRRMVYLNREINNTPNVGPDSLEGKLLILQAYGSSSDAAGASHSFVELYNTTNSPINLNGISLYYADGTSVASNARPNTNTEDGPWKRIGLTGTIPAKGSYLILGPRQNINTTGNNVARYQIPDNSGDINNPDFTLSNRAFKAALIRSTGTLTVQNPFDIDGSGTKVTGYIDMVGSANEYSTNGSERDRIFGFEMAPAKNSASLTVRRASLSDSNNNNTDFASIDYRVWSASNPDRITNEQLEVFRPKNSVYGPWDPFRAPAPPPSVPPVPTGNTLLIFQIGAATDGNISHSFVELYNNGDTDVNLAGYSLQYAEGTRNTPAATEDGSWQKIDLSGTIPPHHSFLILGDEGIGQTLSTNPALALTAGSGDMNVSLVISNRSFKVALMSNTTLLTVQNPFDTGGGVKATGYVDMVGAMNTVGEDKINGFEYQPITNLNKQTGQRRTSLTDSDINGNDFARATYAGASAENKEIWRPKNLAYGAWNPITGESQQ
ncbi:MAG: CotH kinase family protein [Treponema sp.]|jgi:hypothetical protein|nr:CotH kinase family protein [Treponema sp.]